MLYVPRHKSRSSVRSANDCYRGGCALYMPQIGADWLSDKYRVYVTNTEIKAGAMSVTLAELVTHGDDSHANFFVHRERAYAVIAEIALYLQICYDVRKGLCGSRLFLSLD